MNWKATTWLGLFMTACALAQTVGGSAGISGEVKDPSGAAVPNAKVVISSASQGTLRNIETNNAGVFAAPALTPGAGYKVAVTAAGFAPYEVSDITLAVGQNLNLNVPLTVGGTSTTVEVVGAAELLDDTKADVSTVVDNKQIQELPVNGRRVDSFVLLTPGVSNDATFGLLTFRGVAGNNSFLIDGNDNTEQFYDENAGRTRIQSQISQDAVQEFQVVSDDYSAEYGRAMGGVVNTVTKSGSNQLHGSAFYYYRSTGFDAADTFATVGGVRINPSEKRVEGGGSLGGALIKDKLFWFVTGDLTHRDFPMIDSYVLTNVVNPATQNWVTTGSQACASPATPAQCASINNLLGRFFGLIPRKDDNDLAFGRLDYHASDKNTFTAEFNFLRWLSPNGIQTGLSSTSGAGITGNGDDSVRVRNGKLGWTWVPTSTLVNNFHFGWDTDRQADSFDSAELGGGLGYLDVSVDGVQLGPATYLPRVEPSETRYEVSDDATLVKSNHNIKFGFNFFTTEDYNYYISNAWGSYTYTNPTCFALDYSPAPGGTVDTACGSTSPTNMTQHWSAFSQTFGNPVADYRINELAGYVNDSWKVSSKLTVNLGVRWDKSMSMTFPVSNPAWPQTGYIHTPNHDFSPRVGLAYRINNKTVFRGGFGLFYARLLGGLIDDLWTTNALYQLPLSYSASSASQLAAGPVFPNRLPATTTPPAGTSTIQFAAPNLQTPYSAQANITLERQLTSDTLLSVSGIMSRGIHLLGSVDLNVNPPTGSMTYTVNNTSGQAAGTYTVPVYTAPRPNTAFGSVIENTNGVDSVYDGLAVTLNKRFTHGLQMLGSYTWSHEIDDGQGQATNAIFYSSLTTLWNGNNAAERANGWLDQRQRFVYSFVYAPEIHFNNTFLKAILGDWQLSAVATLASGRPYTSPGVTGSIAACTATVTTGCAQIPAGQSLLSTSFPNAFTGSHRVPWLPLNDILTPASYRADARITKFIPFKIADHDTRLSLNFEMFNVSNSWSPTGMTGTEYVLKSGTLTPNFSTVNGVSVPGWGVGSSDGGFPDGTQARRMQISARFQF